MVQQEVKILKLFLRGLQAVANKLLQTSMHSSLKDSGMAASMFQCTRQGVQASQMLNACSFMANLNIPSTWNAFLNS